LLEKWCFWQRQSEETYSTYQNEHKVASRIFENFEVTAAAHIVTLSSNRVQPEIKMADEMQETRTARITDLEQLPAT
jgi:hypothetical protein